jgi:FlaG/FlaF family flagellin (archaellin)
MKPVPLVLVSIGAALAAGCSTLTQGTSQEISLVTPGADGATCTVSEAPGDVMATVTTPASVRLSRSRKDVQVSCQKEQYKPESVIIRSKFANRSMIQMPVGYLVDGVSGAMWQYPSEVRVALTRSPSASSTPAENLPATGAN